MSAHSPASFQHVIMLALLISVMPRLGRSAFRQGGGVRVLPMLLLAALPGVALLYVLLSSWRPTPFELFLSLAAGLLSDLVSRFIYSGMSRERPANLAERGRDQDAGMRSLLTRSAVVLAASAVALAVVDVRLGLGLWAAMLAWILVSLLPFLRTVESAVSITINRPPEEVFDFLADARNQPWYLPAVESVEAYSLGSPRLGSRFLVRLWDGTEAEEKILEYDRPRRLSSGLPDAPQPNRSIWMLRPVPKGTCVRYSYRVQLTTWQALSGMWLMQAWLGALQNGMRRRWLQRLKYVLESGALLESADDAAGEEQSA